MAAKMPEFISQAGTLLPFKAGGGSALPLLDLVMCSHSHLADQLDQLTNPAENQPLARLVLSGLDELSGIWKGGQQQVDTPSNSFHPNKKLPLKNAALAASWCFAELHMQAAVC